MDDKKKSLSEETKELTSKNDEVVDFDDVRNASDKQNAKLSLKEDKQEKVIESETEVKQADKDILKKELTDKKTDSKDEEPTDKKEDSKKEEPDQTEKDLSEKDSVESKAGLKKAESNQKEKDLSEKEPVEKKPNSKQAEEDKKEISSDEKKVNEEKEKSVGTNAISQSKRLADAKAIKDAESKQISGENNKNKADKPKNKKRIIFGSLVAVLAIVYIAGFVYFSNYFYPNVVINGTNVSSMDKATAKQTLDNFYKDYVLTLETIDNKQVTIAGNDISMQIVLHDEFNECLKKQQAYLWFVNMFKHHDYTIGADATWDADALASIYKDMKMLDKKLMTAPKDAYIGVDDGKFAIIKEELGTTILVDLFKTTVEDSLLGVVANVNLKDAGCYKLPEVYETDEKLKSEFDAKSEYATAVINIQLDDFTLEPGMDLYDAVLEKNGDSYKVSKSLVKDYVSNLAEEYDTLGKDRTFTTSFNNKKVEINGTAFGYEMDQEATADALYDALVAKKTTTVEAVFTNKGYTLLGENDIGDTYIEVNLSEQYVVAYKDGKKIAEGDCVSGKESTGDGTCLGLYAIQDKLSPTVLRGQKKEVTKIVTKKNKKGKKVKVKKTTMEYEYESPVTYWMQFNGGYGLHDAAGWRSVYGGSIYYYSGSHGCVNLPLDLAETLYKNFEIGDPVLVYFWDNENRK